MKILFVLFPIIVLLLLTGIFGIMLFQPVDKGDTTPMLFVVNQGESISNIAKKLENQKLIRNRYVFLFEVRHLGLENKIQAGDFRLSKNQTPSQIAQHLTTGTLDVWVRIIEGWRAEEVAAELKKQVPAYEESWVSELKKDEGYLFPDTYLIPKNADIKLVFKILKGNFDSKMAQLKGDVGKNGLSLEGAIILASIVEREARSSEVKTQVASILLKRFNIGMKLDADATVQYALGFQPTEKSWWKKSLTTDDLKVRSPYNTYTNAGLPPTPISNPGFASLQAVFDADPSTPYLYYLHDSQGNSYYSKTLEEHEANKAKHL